MSAQLVDNRNEEIEWLQWLMNSAVIIDPNNSTTTRYKIERKLTIEEFHRVIRNIEFLKLYVEMFSVGCVSPHPACKLWISSEARKRSVIKGIILSEPLFVIDSRHCLPGALKDMEDVPNTTGHLDIAFWRHFYKLSDIVVKDEWYCR